MTQTDRREQMLAAVEEAENGFERLRASVQLFLNDGVPPEILLEDLEQIRALVPEALEDTIMDVMDLLSGWCAPSARLKPQ